MRRSGWRSGNRVRLLENGEAFFPRVIEAIACARESVYVETFIFGADSVGEELRDALRASAARGVRIDVLADHFGSPGLQGEFLESLTSAGIRVLLFEPGARILGWRTNVFRRLHRKIVLVDRRRLRGRDQLLSRASAGSAPRRCTTTQWTGRPVVDDIAHFVDASKTAGSRWRFPRLRARRRLHPSGAEPCVAARM